MNIRISGNLKGPTVIFLAGWPDTCDVFHNNLMQKIQSSHRIIGLTLPGFDDDLPFVRQYHERMCHAKQQNLDSDTLGHSSSVRKQTTNEGSTSSKLMANLGATRSGVVSYSSILQSSLSGLTPAKTPKCGYSFVDLLALLEIAVDVSLENHNYCRSSCFPEKSNVADQTTIKPILITHGWGCLLVKEFLLVRPHALSKVVLLDVGGSIFQHTEVERCIRSYFDGCLPVPAQMSRTLTRRDKMWLLLVAQHKNREQRKQPIPKSDVESDVDKLRFVPPEAPKSKHPFYPRELKDGSGAFLRFWLWWWHAFVVVILFCVPRPIGNVFLRMLLWIAGRPSYRQDDKLRFTMEAETLNYRLEVQRYYSQQYYAGKGDPTSAIRIDDDNYASSIPRSGVSDGGPRPPPLSATCGTFDISRHCSGNTEGWQIVLFPFLKTVDEGSNEIGNQNECMSSSKGDDPPRYTSSGRRRRHLATEFTEDVSSSQRYRTISKGGRSKGPRVIVVRRGYAKGTIGTNREKHTMHVNTDQVNPYYSAYLPTGVRRVFQEPASSNPFPRKSENAHNGTRTVFRKWEVVYKEYYIPPLSSSRMPTAVGSNSTTVAGKKQRRKLGILDSCRRGWRKIRKWFKCFTGLLNRVHLKHRKISDEDVEDEDEEEEDEQEQELNRDQQMDNMWIVHADQRMGWLFLRYACGCVLSRMFSPKGNWSPSSYTQALQKQWRQEIRLRKRRTQNTNDVKDPFEKPRMKTFNSVLPIGMTPEKDHSQSQSISISSTLPHPDFTPYQYMHSPLVSQRFFLPLHVPVLFMYGGGKRFMLHSRQWSEYVQCKGLVDGKSKVVCVEGAGHWFFAEPKHRDEVADEVFEFITQ